MVDLGEKLMFQIISLFDKLKLVMRIFTYGQLYV